MSKHGEAGFGTLCKKLADKCPRFHMGFKSETFTQPIRDCLMYYAAVETAVSPIRVPFLVSYTGVFLAMEGEHPFRLAGEGCGRGQNDKKNKPKMKNFRRLVWA